MSRTTAAAFNLQSFCVVVLLLLVTTILVGWSRPASAFPVVTTTTTTTTTTNAVRATSWSSLWMYRRYRGLEKRRESATPTEGGMILYVPAGPNGTSIGNCPEAQFVRMVLEEKGLEYEVKPTTDETKPLWLLEFYQGKLPALRHGKECYINSNRIADYLDFFFVHPPLQPSSYDSDTPSSLYAAAQEAVKDFGPVLAHYIQQDKIPKREDDNNDDDDDDVDMDLAPQKQANLMACLQKLEDHLLQHPSSGPYLAGPNLTLVDCRLATQLYSMETALGAGGDPDAWTALVQRFPRLLGAYKDTIFARDSFQKTVYPPKEVVTQAHN